MLTPGPLKHDDGSLYVPVSSLGLAWSDVVRSADEAGEATLLRSGSELVRVAFVRFEYPHLAAWCDALEEFVRVHGEKELQPFGEQEAPVNQGAPPGAVLAFQDAKGRPCGHDEAYRWTWLGGWAWYRVPGQQKEK